MPNWLRLETSRRQVAIVGRVTDAQTGAAIPQARVEITASPQVFAEGLALRSLQYGVDWATMAERPDRTSTADDGLFHFLDLPAGQYTLAVSLPNGGSRFGQAEANADVVVDANGTIALAAADVPLPTTAIGGQVRTQNSGEPVAMAEVRVQGSGERAFSDQQGHYLLNRIETGERRLQVTARGFQPVTQAVSLGPPGTKHTVDFNLNP